MGGGSGARGRPAKAGPSSQTVLRTRSRRGPASDRLEDTHVPVPGTSHRSGIGWRPAAHAASIRDAMQGSNGSASGPAKDGGIAAILLEIRDMRREAAEDRRDAAADRQRADAKFAEFRREAAEDRRQAAADRRQAAEDRREAAADRRGIVQLLAQLDDHIVAQGKTLVAQGKTLARIEVGQRALVHAITDLTRTLRLPRNGRNGGNGRHRK